MENWEEKQGQRFGVKSYFGHFPSSTGSGGSPLSKHTNGYREFFLMGWAKRQLAGRRLRTSQNPMDKAAHPSADELLRASLLAEHGADWVLRLWASNPTRFLSPEEQRYLHRVPQ